MMSEEEQPRRSTRANRGQNRFARWNLDTETPVKPIRKRKAEPVDGVSQTPKPKSKKADKSSGEIKCPCGQTEYDESDDKIMVECENCLTWQHVVCIFGVNTETVVPEPYLCPDCQPQEESKDPVVAENKIEDIHDKVRQSACMALQRILTQEVVPKAIANGVLEADTDVNAFSETMAIKLESALYEHHANKPVGRSKKAVDVGNKYRDHFRSLQFNLKGNKNEELQMRIASGELTPDECVTLTVEQMMNPELRKLAESVRKEAIRETVLKVEDEDAPRVRKTHKGEEFVGDEPELPEAPAKSVTAPVSEQPAVKAATEAKYEQTNFDMTFSPPEYGFSDAEDAQDGDQEEPNETVPSIIPVWDGKVIMSGIAEFPATAFHLGGKDFDPELWSSIVNVTEPQTVSGRVDRSVAFKYLEVSAMKRTIASFAIISDEAAPCPEFRKVYEYHKSRAKVGVLPNRSAIAKDAYMVPIDKTEEIPHFLALTEAQKTQLNNWLDKSPVLLGVFVLPNAKALAAAHQRA